jgi:hypothetical protein
MAFRAVNPERRSGTGRGGTGTSTTANNHNRFDPGQRARQP